MLDFFHKFCNYQVIFVCVAREHVINQIVERYIRVLCTVQRNTLPPADKNGMFLAANGTIPQQGGWQSKAIPLPAQKILPFPQARGDSGGIEGKTAKGRCAKIY